MMDASGFAAVLDALFAFLTAFALACARPAGFAAIFPLFTRLGLTGLNQGAFVVSIALPVAAVKS